MQKEFNITGTCIPDRHFMVDIHHRLLKIQTMIEKGQYFVMNRPRQFGKTTTLFLLKNYLIRKYVVLSLSFEGTGDEIFDSEKKFANSFVNLMKKSLKFQKQDSLLNSIEESDLENLNGLSRFISDLVIASDKEIILLIDEVDKTSTSPVFLNFLSMLRDKYLKRNAGEDKTFQSVILAGLNDVKNLKARLRNEENAVQNSPWNIAANFTMDMSFSAAEISSMLKDYAESYHLSMDIPLLSEKLHFYTNGYPSLASRLCKIIDEVFMEEKKTEWTEEMIEESVKELLKENNTLFESVIKNIENNSELYSVVYRIVLDGEKILYNYNNPVIEQGVLHGIFLNSNGDLKISNRIFEQLIYDYLISKLQTSEAVRPDSVDSSFTSGQTLNLNHILLKFQEFMKEQHSEKDLQFIERNGRLLFLSFLKLIINGHGFDFREVEISEERRLDITVTYYNKKYIVELKIWRGETSHQKGLAQLSDYLERTGLSEGYLLIFQNKKSKEFRQDTVKHNGKTIYAVWT